VSALPIEDHAGHRRTTGVLGHQIKDADLDDVLRPDHLERDAVVGLDVVAHD
jgi:hypothetical protein